ncbi:MAG: tRNA (guanosine(46)-N7)-methyltransferase TrmB [Proteobacteria bacterium]|nr:tRNA (guanosine(46)-N7)-methyltransferase TrmB [Pseudomonadota bacterium]
MAQLNQSRVYIRRQGRMTRAQSRGLATLLGQYQVSTSATSVCWETLFGRAAPLCMEVGFGMGHALLATAQQHPEWNCIGVEVYRPGIGALLNALDAAQLENVRIVEGDARAVLADSVEPASLHRVMVFFPDPWPKSKHHKRRLVNAEFAALVASRLAADGELLLASDWEHYAQGMQAVLDAEPDLENLAGTGHFVARNDERPTTRFEARGLRLGHQVWDLAYRRREDVTGNR